MEPRGLATASQVHAAIWSAAAEVESKHGITVRPMRKKDMEAEIGRFLEVYNAAWERNWGFVPLTEDEVRHYAKDLKPILDENWAFVAEKDGETVGAALTLPDYNQVLTHLNGRLLPFGWAKALWYRRKIDRVRVFALGVKREWQHTGVAAKFYELHFDSAERTPQTGGEMGWILEIEQVDEPRDGGDGRPDRPHLPGLREDPLNMTDRAVTMSSMSRDADLPAEPTLVDGARRPSTVCPCSPMSARSSRRRAARCRPSRPPRPRRTGFVAGAATLALVRRHSARKLARAQRKAPRRPLDMLPIVGSRTFLVDVHLIAKPGE